MQNADRVSKAPPTLQAEKFSMTVLSPDSVNQTAESSVVGGRSSPAVTGNSREGGNSPTPDDGNLRQEVEQLRRAVETLSAQQPQVVQVYQQGHDNLPDEPPPMYN